MRGLPTSSSAATIGRLRAEGLGRMRILIHDFAGHPFQAQLSRELAKRGHEIVHAWFGQDTGPKGLLSKCDDDPQGLSFSPIFTNIDYSKTNFVKRREGDLAYGRAIGSLVELVCPDVVISGNTPTEAQEKLVAICKYMKVPFIYWCQDFYSIAASSLLERRLPLIGHIVGAYYRFLERRQMRSAAHVVHITDSFSAQTDKWGVDRSRVTTIPNWGAIDEIPLRPRDNAWSEQQKLSPRTRYLYAGTLGLKHNPELIARLAVAAGEDDSVILVSAGTGTDQLRDRASSLPNLTLMPLQPFEVFPDVLASADVLLAVIEREAGTFSVPSKILSYLCAGRPIVLAAPQENLAARIVIESGAGTVVEPEDAEGFAAAALQFAGDPAAAASAGRAARRYAEENFVIANIADRFEVIFIKLINSADK